MTAIPQPTNLTLAAIDDHCARTPDLPRPHMGVSLLGHECDRYLWLKFRWALSEKIDGRKRRLFDRGNREEPVVLNLLRAIGVKLREVPAGSQQHRVDFGSHVSGSLDAIADSGVLEAPTKPHVIEIKTMSRKNFDIMEKCGVAEAQPKHFTQMQVYMHGTNIDRALYVAVCKDDDRLHVERVRYDRAVAEKAIARGKRLAIVDEMPPPLSTDATWWQCKTCEGHDWCHRGVGIEEKNCRTCAWSTAKDDSTWRCEKHNADGIPVDFQRTGCADYDVHDFLLPF